jgi:hypothetical protein
MTTSSSTAGNCCGMASPPRWTSSGSAGMPRIDSPRCEAALGLADHEAASAGPGLIMTPNDLPAGDRTGLATACSRLSGLPRLPFAPAAGPMGPIGAASEPGAHKCHRTLIQGHERRGDDHRQLHPGRSMFREKGTAPLYRCLRAGRHHAASARCADASRGTVASIGPADLLRVGAVIRRPHPEFGMANLPANETRRLKVPY